MKINSTPYPVFANIINKEKSAAQASAASKISAREQVQQHIAKLQEAASSTGQNNAKVQAIYEKFKSGKKLSIGEMNYLRMHAPGLVAKIEQVHLERVGYEQGMKSAPSKMGVHLVALTASQQMSKGESAEVVEIRSKHLQDAIMEYTASDDYKEKPETVEEDRKDKKHKKLKVTNLDPDFGKIYKSSASTVYTLEMVSTKLASHMEQ